MTTFAIDNDNTIMTFLAGAQIPEGQEQFASEKDLAALAANWPADRLIAIWNSFAGVAGFGADLKPVKKFTDRKSGISRVWKAIQKLDGADAATAPAAAPTPEAATPKAAKPAKATKKAAKSAPPKTKAAKLAKKAAKAAAATPREGSKKADVIAMLQRKGGATMAEIAKATDWQNHTIRGFMAGAMKKAGYTIESTKSEQGERTYRIAAK